MLLHYLDELESKRPPLLDYKATNDKALLAVLIFNNPDLSAKRILQIFGLTKALESMNMRELRGMFAKHNQRGWHRLMDEAKNIKISDAQSPFGIIRERLIKYRHLKLEDFKF